MDYIVYRDFICSEKDNPTVDMRMLRRPTINLLIEDAVANIGGNLYDISDPSISPGSSYYIKCGWNLSGRPDAVQEGGWSLAEFLLENDQQLIVLTYAISLSDQAFNQQQVNHFKYWADIIFIPGKSEIGTFGDFYRVYQGDNGYYGFWINYMDDGTPVLASIYVEGNGVYDEQLTVLEEVGRLLSADLASQPRPVYGCTDPSAENYNPNATVDDGSCVYEQPVPESTPWYKKKWLWGLGVAGTVLAGIIWHKNKE